VITHVCEAAATGIPQHLIRLFGIPVHDQDARWLGMRLLELTSSAPAASAAVQIRHALEHDEDEVYLTPAERDAVRGVLHDNPPGLDELRVELRL
jgi:hypothetical protein